MTNFQKLILVLGIGGVGYAFYRYADKAKLAKDTAGALGAPVVDTAIYGKLNNGAYVLTPAGLTSFDGVMQNRIDDTKNLKDPNNHLFAVTSAPENSSKSYPSIVTATEAANRFLIAGMVDVDKARRGNTELLPAVEIVSAMIPTYVEAFKNSGTDLVIIAGPGMHSKPDKA